MPKFNAEIISALSDGDVNLGYGYFGSRSNLAEETRTEAEELIVGIANIEGWSCEILVEWLNSRLGRRFADCFSNIEGYRNLSVQTARLEEMLETEMRHAVAQVRPLF